jgi:hypothetical protein
MPTIIRRGKTACVVLAMALAAGCSDAATEPENPGITGAWSGYAAGMVLSIGVTEKDGKFSGFGNFSVGQAAIPVTVHGGRNGTSIALMLRTDGYQAAAFTGTLTDVATIQGTLNHSGFQDTPITLHKRWQ